jgi:hypothetical protein
MAARSIKPRERHDRYPPYPVNGENLSRCGRKNFAGLALRRFLLGMRPFSFGIFRAEPPALPRNAGDVKEIFRRPDSFLFLSNAAWRAENPDAVGNLSPLTGRMSRGRESKS